LKSKNIIKGEIKNNTLKTTNIQVGFLKASHSSGDETNQFKIGFSLKPSLDFSIGVENKTTLKANEPVNIKNIEGGQQ